MATNSWTSDFHSLLPSSELPQPPAGPRRARRRGRSPQRARRPSSPSALEHKEEPRLSSRVHRVPRKSTRCPVSVRSSISGAKITVFPGLEVTLIHSLPAPNFLHVYKKGPTFHEGRRSSQVPPVGDLDERRKRCDTQKQLRTTEIRWRVGSPRATADLPQRGRTRDQLGVDAAVLQRQVEALGAELQIGLAALKTEGRSRQTFASDAGF